jgi:hypothetical protein
MFPVVAVILILVAIFGAAPVEEMSRLPASMEVVNSTCDSHDGRTNITSVTLRVTYNSSEPITVHAHSWDSKRHIQHSWDPRNITLEPGTQTVTIRAPRPRAGIGPNSRAQVYLNHGQRRVIENWEVESCA